MQSCMTQLSTCDSQIMKKWLFVGTIILMGIVKHHPFASTGHKIPGFTNLELQVFFLTKDLKFCLDIFISLTYKNSLTTEDRLFRIRPIVDMMQRQFIVNYNSSHFLSIDEAMVHYGFLQYRPMKPTKWGIKIFCLCDTTNGYLCDFIGYTGRNGPDPEKNLSMNTVSLLTSLC